MKKIGIILGLMSIMMSCIDHSKYEVVTEPKILWAKYAETEWDGKRFSELETIHYFLFSDKTLITVSVRDYMIYNPNDTVYVSKKIPIR